MAIVIIPFQMGNGTAGPVLITGDNMPAGILNLKNLTVQNYQGASKSAGLKNRIP